MLLAASFLDACAGAGTSTPSQSTTPNSAPAATPSQSPAASSAAAAKPIQAATSSAAAGASGSGLEKLRLGVLSSLSDAGLWIGLDKGFFKDVGLDVQTTRFGSAADMIAPLAANQIDAGGGAPGVGLDNAVLRGVDIHIIADKGTITAGHGFEAFMARKDLYDSGAIRGPADLKGRKFALASLTGITAEASLEHYMAEAGLHARDTSLVALSFPEMAAAFANKSIDAAAPIEPFATQIVANGSGVILVRGDAVHPNHTTAVVLAGPAAQQNPDLIRKFMVGYLRGVRFYNDAFDYKDEAKRAEAIDILAKHTPVKDRALYDKMVVSYLNPNGEPVVQSLKDDQDYFISAGLQKERVDMDKVVDLDFARYAVKQLGPYKPA